MVICIGAFSQIGDSPSIRLEVVELQRSIGAGDSHYGVTDSTRRGQPSRRVCGPSSSSHCLWTSCSHCWLRAHRLPVMSMTSSESGGAVVSWLFPLRRLALRLLALRLFPLRLFTHRRLNGGRYGDRQVRWPGARGTVSPGFTSGARRVRATSPGA